MVLTIIAFIVVLGILVFVHELGHFIAAKKTGVKVEEFALGFPPRIYSAKRGETEYSINAFPLGGYVKMLGELEHSSDKRAFENQKPGKRFIISIAGVIMNLILAWVLLTAGFAIGMSPVVSNPDTIPGKKLTSDVIIADVSKDSPAAAAGLQAGDIALKASTNTEEKSFKSPSDLSAFTGSHKNQEITITVKRDNTEISKSIMLSNTDAPLGVSVVEKAIVRVTWYKAPYIALKETYGITKLTGQFLAGMFKNIFTHGKVSEGVGGPVAIYMYTGLAVKAGMMVLLQFIAMLSINLALINILPFPALDGGRLLFIVLEKLYGKKVVKERVENIIHTVGFALLILLIVAITYRDVVHLIIK